MTRLDTRRDVLPLAGYSVAVTAARRRDELGALLERRGARVVQAPAISIVPLADDTDLLAATAACLAAPPDTVVVTTGIGFRGWVEAADGWGLGDALREVLAAATVLARGPKARGAVRAAGLVDAWSPPSESSAEVLDHLLASGVAGRRVAVQLHGEPLPDVVDALVAAGADVVEVPVYRWVPTPDVTALHRVIDGVAGDVLDAVAFTSAPAVATFLQAARERGLEDTVLDALRARVVAACVGPVTAAPLASRDVPTVQPGRARLGDLVRAVVAAVPERRGRAVPVAGHVLEVRGHAVVLDGTLLPVAPAPMAVLRRLASCPGRVMSRRELLPVLPGEGVDEHAVEMAVTRLRSALGDARIVQTVVKRGYRLACDAGSAAVARSP